MSSLGPILLFAAGLAADGVARNTVHLANALGRRGFAVEVVCLHDGALAADLRGIPVTRLGRGSLPRGLELARAVPALHRWMLRAAPSVVVSMGNHAHLAVWAALRGLPDIPRIYRISNDPVHGDSDPIRRALRMATLRLVAADATRIVCVSSAIADRGCFRRVRRDRRLDVLPNGVDVDMVRARAAEPTCHPWILSGRPYVVAVGRLHAQKNYDHLIDALALARVERPDLGLLILGGGSCRARARLEGRARALGLGAALRFEGEVANPHPLMARAAAYALTSRWEGASNSLLEALACGVPVVASQTAGAASEVLSGGRFGALADPDDPCDLARAILKQLDPSTSALPGERAVDFRIDATLARLCAVIAGARRVHNEVQTQPEWQRHPAPLSQPIPERTKEF